jgi:hypothetical protein
LGHGCLSLVSLCCAVLCRYRPCDGLITRPGSPTVRRKNWLRNRINGGQIPLTTMMIYTFQEVIKNFNKVIQFNLIINNVAFYYLTP